MFRSSSEIKNEIIERARKMPALPSSRMILNASGFYPGLISFECQELIDSVYIMTSNCGIDSSSSLREYCASRQIVFVVTTAFEDTSFLAKTLSSIWSLDDPSCPIVYFFKDASKSSQCKDFLSDFASSRQPVCRSFACVYLHTEDRGMYHGLQQAFDCVKALAPAETSVLTYINADDVLYPYSAALATSIFTAQKIHWITGFSSVIDDNDVEIFANAIVFNRQDIAAGLFLGKLAPFIQQEGTFWTLDLYNRVRGFNPDLNLAGDLDLWLQFSHVEDICSVRVKMGSFRKRIGQKSENIHAYYEESAMLPISSSVVSRDPLYKATPNMWPKLSGYAASSSSPYDIGKYYVISDNRLVPEFREWDDDLFYYPMSLRELEGRTVKYKLDFYPRDPAQQDVHIGIQGLNIYPLPDEYYYYTCIRPSQSQWFDSVFAHEESLPKIIKIRLVAMQCQINAKARVVVNGVVRCVNFEPALKSIGCYNDFVEIRIFQPANPRTSILIEFMGCSYGFASIHPYCLILPSSFGTYENVHKILQSWPYLCGGTHPIYKNDYLDRLPLVSIIVPTYSQGNTIRDTLSSIYSQGYPRLQVILLDGFSKDSTRSVISDFLTFVSEIRSFADGGQSATISEGIDMAKGEIITWLNTDDMLAPGALFKVANHYLLHQDAEVIVGNCIVFKRNEYVFQHSPQVWGEYICPAEILDVHKYWLKGKYFHQPECFFTRKAIEKVAQSCKDVFINQELYYSMDFDIWAKMAIAKCIITRINSPLAIYRMSDEQKTSSVDRYLPELESHSRALLNQYSDILSSNHLSDANMDGRAGALGSWSDLRVFMFNDVGFFGGAGIAHKRIAKSLMLYGVSVQCFSASDVWLEQGVHIDLEVLSSTLESFNPHLIICGNIHGICVDHLKLLGMLSSKAPCWFVAHDFWITNGSDPYPSNAWECPLGSSIPNVKPWIKRLNNINGLMLVPNSIYTREVLQSAGLSHVIEDMSFRLSVETEQATIDNSFAYQSLADNYCPSRVNVAIGSVGLLEPRKGADLILEAISLLDPAIAAQIHISSYGFSPLEEIARYCSYNHLGFLPEAEVLALMSRMDVFVSMSSIETFGQTSVEALKQGVYLIVAQNGGSISYAQDGFNSFVINRDSESLADALASLVKSVRNGSQPLTCCNRVARSLSVENFSLAEQGYSLLRSIVKCTSLPYPIGGQRVGMGSLSDMEIQLNVMQ
jgi:glycosyltransferase involved in cell wall biosynthesis